MDLKDYYAHLTYSAQPPNLSSPIILIAPEPLVVQPTIKYAYLQEAPIQPICYTPVPQMPSAFGQFSRVPTQYAVGQSTFRVSPSEQNFIGLDASKSVSVSVPQFQLNGQIVKRKFDELCSDPNVSLNPQALNLIPTSLWKPENVTFGYLVSFHFRKRNSSNSKFPIKLYNALRITEQCPDFFPHIGVKWVTDDVIWVNRETFACLIGVKTVEGGLFHQQGNFPSHGFVELSFEESQMLAHTLNLGRIDLSVMRLVRHKNGIFRRGCTELDIFHCQWKG